MILDNLSAHMAPDSDRLARRSSPSPLASSLHADVVDAGSTSSSVGSPILTDRRLRRGVFGSVGELTERLRMWVKHWNEDPKPFIWTKAAEEIVEKVRRGRAALHQVNSATGH